MLEVGTNARVRDVCESVATRLQLASWEGCSLFIKISDKVGGPAGQGPGERVGVVRGGGCFHLCQARPLVAHRLWGRRRVESEPTAAQLVPGQCSTWPPSLATSHLNASLFLLSCPRSSARRRETSSLTLCDKCLTG